MGSDMNVSSEFVWIRDVDTGKEYKFRPGIPFKWPDGRFLNLNSCIIHTADGKYMIQPGERFESGQNRTLADMTLAQLKEMARSQNLSFPKRATKTKMLEILNGT